uniref:Endonuclease/exonuclease/phosphatase domain-containing protein n=1 Tax=Xiphophorus couchianus TaxID=32473 RepID=A0A3B5LQA0_9TELE
MVILVQLHGILMNSIALSRGLISKIKREKIQILLLQETHLSSVEDVSHSSFKTGHKRGVGVLIHNSYILNLLSIYEIVKAESQGILICAGGFNTVLNKNDTSNNKRTTTPQSKLLKRGLYDIDLLDAWQEMNPTGNKFTYFSPTHTVFSRIDLFLVLRND